jgi:dTDP-4-dehydrorhamnose reductase
MKILITGANGLLGQKLVALLAPKKEVDLIATSRGENRITRVDYPFVYQPLDITQPAEVDRVITQHTPDVIIHTAAMTNVDQCEQEREACITLNVNAVKYLLEAAEKNKSFFIHLSTDFIFAGDHGPLSEDAIPHPVNFYGESKLQAEHLVRNSNVKHAIARTVLVYGITPHMSRSNIILWVKNSLEQGRPIQVVNDQWRTPTLAEDLAMGCYLIAQKQAEGIFHISGEEMLTPYDMAMYTADYFQLDKSLITKTDSTKFTQPAKRPPKTGFIIEKAKQQLGYQPHSFREGIGILDRQMQSL